MSLLKAAGNAASASKSTAPTTTAKGAEKSPSGWDPHEVWRTRVLLPRLEGKPLAAEHQDSTPAKPLLLRSA